VQRHEFLEEDSGKAPDEAQEQPPNQKPKDDVIVAAMVEAHHCIRYLDILEVRLLGATAGVGVIGIAALTTNPASAGPRFMVGCKGPLVCGIGDAQAVQSALSPKDDSSIAISSIAIPTRSITSGTVTSGTGTIPISSRGDSITIAIAITIPIPIPIASRHLTGIIQGSKHKSNEGDPKSEQRK
jgi:hypothetical protein